MDEDGRPVMEDAPMSAAQFLDWYEDLPDRRQQPTILLARRGARFADVNGTLALRFVERFDQDVVASMEDVLYTEDDRLLAVRRDPSPGSSASSAVTWMHFPAGGAGRMALGSNLAAGM